MKMHIESSQRSKDIILGNFVDSIFIYLQQKIDQNRERSDSIFVTDKFYSLLKLDSLQFWGEKKNSHKKHQKQFLCVHASRKR